MKVLLLGNKGQLGREFERILREKYTFEIDAFDIEELDITSNFALKKTVNSKKYDIIINCTAFNNVDLAEENPKTAFDINYLAVRNLIEAASVNKSLLIHYSTDYVFDGNINKPYGVYDRKNPLSCYGKSKKFGEDILYELYDKYILIRTSWLFGFGNSSFPAKLIEWSIENNELEIIEDQVSSPTYTLDLAKATINLINKNILGTFHITNSPTSKLEWAKYILKKIGWSGNLKGIPLNKMNLKAKRPLKTILDNYTYISIIGETLPTWENATDRYLKKYYIELL